MTARRPGPKPGTVRHRFIRGPDGKLAGSRPVDPTAPKTAESEKAGARAGDPSGGQQQLLEMAIGALSRPALLLLDEPSMGPGSHHAGPGLRRHPRPPPRRHRRAPGRVECEEGPWRPPTAASSRSWAPSATTPPPPTSSPAPGSARCTWERQASPNGFHDDA